ncbi:hypothetical protein J2755_000872 [Methanohalophilus levihalophilus]|uniref:hypothetical protein n=1 Tax=Methanohalophilus levihalophilus TaxID=1431282 RepID=UPI001AE7A4FD|nr:hypothetical protein [Methanohalophilus levihalophilus]MBP2029938.1 hypothetical protein [Methanohalophilus levihalophilus]
MKKFLLFSIFVLSVLISGCSDITDTVEEVNQSISQTKEDLEFLSWMTDSMQIIRNDYTNVSDSLSSRDSEKLSEAAIKLRQDSMEANLVRVTYNLSPSIQNVSDRYGTFLDNSYELGTTLEENAPHLEILDMNSTAEEVDEGLTAWNEVYSLLMNENK